MARKNFYEVIKNVGIDVEKEYERIDDLFESAKNGYSVRDLIEKNFLKFSKTFRGRTISLYDFDETYGFDEVFYKDEVSLEDLVLRCEYIINCWCQLVKHCGEEIEASEWTNILLLEETIRSCMDELGFMSAEVDGIVIYVEKDAAAVSVAELVPPKLSGHILEYNHHRLKGDLDKKHNILKVMADYIEPKRKELGSINGVLEKQLFQLLNKFVRHDHSKTPYITDMTKSQLEEVYDDIYQLWLLAELEMDNVKRKNRMKQLLDQINGGIQDS